ncbi:MAG: hypothetical protein SGILL_006237, partial [Bacillariaceae sp.]
CQVNHYHNGHKEQCKIWSRTIKDEPKLEDYPFVEEHQNESPHDPDDKKLYDKARANWDKESAEWEYIRFEIFNRVFYEQFFLPECFGNDRNRKVDVILEWGCATATLSGEYLSQQHANEKIIAFDISPKMIEKVNERYGDRVEGIAGIITDMDDPTIREFREKYRGRVDLIVATIALTFIPRCQAKATFLAFCDLLKPGTGLFAHADTCKENERAVFPNYMTREECETFYKWGKMEKVLWETRTLELKGPVGEVSFPQVLGVAKKPLDEVAEDDQESRVNQCSIN